MATILISDDEAPVGRALMRQLQRRGIRGILDTDSQVVAMAEQEQPSLILLDYTQRTDGAELIGALKKNAATAHIPIIVITAVDADDRRQQCLDLGASGFVPKPFPDSFIDELVEQIEQLRPPTFH
jgi:two-component system phosphate regulon response regulator PhoB